MFLTPTTNKLIRKNLTYVSLLLYINLSIRPNIFDRLCLPYWNHPRDILRCGCGHRSFIYLLCTLMRSVTCIFCGCATVESRSVFWTSKYCCCTFFFCIPICEFSFDFQSSFADEFQSSTQLLANLFYSMQART